VAQPARQPLPNDVPVVDPAAIHEAYRRERARRRMRLERQRAKRAAAFRFVAVLVFLFAVSVALLVTIWHEVQRLFGL
jgi:hypothetical protein